MLQEEERAIVNTRKARAEAALIALILVLGAYGLYLRSRLLAARRRTAVRALDAQRYSGRNVAAAAPSVSVLSSPRSRNWAISRINRTTR